MNFFHLSLDKCLLLFFLRYEKVSGDSESFKVKFEGHVISVTYKPLKIDFYDAEGVLLISVNNRGLLNFEHYRARG